MPWPNAAAPVVAPVYSSREGTMPADSPGKSMPVFWPMPNASMPALNLSAPMSWPTSAAPVFEERRMISVGVMSIV